HGIQGNGRRVLGRRGLLLELMQVQWLLRMFHHHVLLSVWRMFVLVLVLLDRVEKGSVLKNVVGVFQLLGIFYYSTAMLYMIWLSVVVGGYQWLWRKHRGMKYKIGGRRETRVLKRRERIGRDTRKEGRRKK
ncbi:MAG: hypothetical protein BYD32DRAFT_422332, partial [Podila humilis]